MGACTGDPKRQIHIQYANKSGFGNQKAEHQTIPHNIVLYSHPHDISVSK